MAKSVLLLLLCFGTGARSGPRRAEIGQCAGPHAASSSPASVLPSEEPLDRESLAHIAEAFARGAELCRQHLGGLMDRYDGLNATAASLMPDVDDDAAPAHPHLWRCRGALL